MAKRKRKQMMAVLGVAQAVKREFEGIPVVDAEADLSVVLNTAEIEAAKGNEKDPENCVLAKACRQQLRSTKVLFFRSVAYVHHPGEDGVFRVYRYKVRNATRAIIEAFDRKQKVAGNVLVKLEAPRRSDSLEYLRSKGKKHRSERKQRAALVGKATCGGARPFKRTTAKDISVRSGTGMVHFPIVRGRAASKAERDSVSA